jgi:UDP-N-acetylglucosamine 2-epimerase
VVKAFPGLKRRRFALVIQHPVDADAAVENERMRDLLQVLLRSRLDRAVIVHPNNDPGSDGIRQVLDGYSDHPRLLLRRDIPRSLFLGLMRDAAFLIGNSSSGIIEAGSFKTPVIDVGPRQRGRERGPNVMHVEYGNRNLSKALNQLWDGNQFRRTRAANVYGGTGAGARIAAAMARLKIDSRLKRKLIAY